MKKTLILLSLFSFLNAEVINPNYNISPKLNKDQKQMFEKLVEQNKDYMSNKNFKEVLKKNKDFTEQQETVMKQKDVFLDKKIDILLKSNKFAEDSIKNNDRVQLVKLNILDKCILFSKDYNDIEKCKKEYQGN